MAWATEAIAHGPAGAIKVVVKFDSEPDNQDLQTIRSETTGLFRRMYSAWPASQPNIRSYEISQRTLENAAARTVAS